MKTIIGLIAVIIITGCTNHYRAALDEKLAGKSLAEKRIILMQECKNEINGGLKKDNPANVRHFEKIKRICEEMIRK